MKSLLRKVRNFKLIRETKGEVVLAVMAVVAVIGIVGTLYSAGDYNAPDKTINITIPYDGEESSTESTENTDSSQATKSSEDATDATTINITITDDPNAIPEKSKTEDVINIVVVLSPEDEAEYREVGTGSPDPTLVNGLNKEIVLEDNYSEEEMDKATNEITKNFMKYINENSDKNVQDHKKEIESDKISDEKTKQQLAQNKLPDDELSMDIYKSIENLVSENIKSDQLDDIENISAQLFKDFLSKGEETLNSEEDIIKSIKDDLNEKKLLAGEEVVAKRKYLKLLQQAKEEYEQRVAVIDKLDPDSVWTQNLIDYKNDKRIIEDLNLKITEADDFINNYETETAGETADQSTSTSETDQSTTISSDSSTTLQSTTSSTGLETTTSGSTTTTSAATTTTSVTTTTTSGTTTTTTNSELPEYISMYGSIGGYSNSMNLSINLITGDVSGGISLVYSQTETSGDTTKTCSYSIKGSISGQMNLETRQINGSFSGSATSLTEGCYGKDLSYSISGKLNENYSSASGSSSNGWSWSVYK